jgi:hypothetical protein
MKHRPSSATACLWGTLLCGLAFAISGCTIVVEAPDGGFNGQGGAGAVGPGGAGGFGAVGGQGGAGSTGGAGGQGGGGNGGQDVGPRCGNGVCDANEDCRCADCPCAGVCGRIQNDWICGEPCGDGQGCPAGDRCFEGFPSFEGAACLPDRGETPVGAECTNSLDCATGLVCSCSDNWNCPGGSVCVEACNDDCDSCETKRWGTRICERGCSPDAPDACLPGTHCLSSATDTGCTRAGDGPWVCYPRETENRCSAQAPPAFGMPCGRGRSCAIDEACVGTTCEQTPEGVGCETYQCSRPCQDGSDCEDPQAVCWRAASRDLGFCVPSLD